MGAIVGTLVTSTCRISTMRSALATFHRSLGKHGAVVLERSFLGEDLDEGLNHYRLQFREDLFTFRLLFA